MSNLFNSPQHTSRPTHSRSFSSSSATNTHRAYIAFGSNLGDRIAMIDEACRHMDQRGIKILRTSSLWETEAMYVLDQAKFVNGVCEVETGLPPLELLDELQAIERDMGRQKVIDKGPRNIDLDILLHSDNVVDHPRLTIPHKLMLEREFVLRPLSELIPDAHLPIPHQQKTISQHLHSLPPPTSPMSTLTPLSPHHPPLKPLMSTRPTRIMGILNITPDSFSDGGIHTTTSTSTLLSTVSSFISGGATILDIGGQSTRPNAPSITAAEEISRILPAIHAIRTSPLPETRTVILSVDTYRAAVAEAAIAAGADLINDVSAGTLDPAMLPTVARLGCSISLMHMRGTPSTMTSLASYPDGVIPTVARELLARVVAAEKAGIRRWRIMLDPGLGFAKNASQNLELLRCMSSLRDFEPLRGLPWLLGPSRKGFVGRVTGVERPAERIWGTAGCVSACVAGEADVVRVHDVGEMAQVVRMADAIWRV